MPLLVLFYPIFEIFLLYKCGEHFGYMNLIFFLISKALIASQLMKLQNPFYVLVGFLLLVPALFLNSIGLMVWFYPTRMILKKLFFNQLSKIQGQQFQFFKFGGSNFSQADEIFKNFGFQNQSSNPFYEQSNSNDPRDVTPKVIDVTPIKSESIHDIDKDKKQ